MITKIIDTKIEGVHLLNSQIFKDNRGWFRETYKMTEFLSANLPTEWRQENCSFSHKGTIRGLHFQLFPFAQKKLISCFSGKIVDFVVDIRFNSDTFLNYLEIELSAENGTYYLFLKEWHMVFLH